MLATMHHQSSNSSEMQLGTRAQAHRAVQRDPGLCRWGAVPMGEGSCFKSYVTWILPMDHSG